MSEAPVFSDLAFRQEAGIVVELSPRIRRIIAPNAGPMTFTGTCTYIVGRGAVAVVDPGPDLPSHIDAILDALRGERVAQILVTHTHRDHSPGARLLKGRTGAPILGCSPYAPARRPHKSEEAAVAASNDLAYVPDRELADGEQVEGPGYTLEAIATPGHTMNHLAFSLVEDQALLSGDHVMAWSTTIVSPPTGSMGAYMRSLIKLRSREDRVYWPGHGGPVVDPRRYVRALYTYRRQRERAILGRLGQGDDTAEKIVGAIYENLNPLLKRAAALSVLAHLEDLLERRRVVSRDAPGPSARFVRRD